MLAEGLVQPQSQSSTNLDHEARSHLGDLELGASGRASHNCALNLRVVS